MLEVRELGFDYADKNVLKQVDFTLRNSELLHLRGINGAGKSTLLKLLAGILVPNHGDIFFKGRSITEDLPSYQKNICYVGHKPGVNQLLSVREHYRFELQALNPRLSFDDLITCCALDGLEDMPCRLLSAGQRHRVGLMRLWVSSAPLWLLDEPLVALDKEAIGIFVDLVHQHLKKGGAVVLSSHQELPSLSYQEYCL